MPARGARLVMPLTFSRSSWSLVMPDRASRWVTPLAPEVPLLRPISRRVRPVRFFSGVRSRSSKSPQI